MSLAQTLCLLPAESMRRWFTVIADGSRRRTLTDSPAVGQFAAGHYRKPRNSNRSPRPRFNSSSSSGLSVIAEAQAFPAAHRYQRRADTTPLKTTKRFNIHTCL